MLHPITIILRRAWWSFVASKWSGGGPRHQSYAYARFEAHIARREWELWLHD